MVKDARFAYVRVDFVDALTQHMNKLGVALTVGDPYPPIAKNRVAVKEFAKKMDTLYNTVVKENEAKAYFAALEPNNV